MSIKMQYRPIPILCQIYEWWLFFEVMASTYIFPMNTEGCRILYAITQQELQVVQQAWFQDATAWYPDICIPMMIQLCWTKVNNPFLTKLIISHFNYQSTFIRHQEQIWSQHKVATDSLPKGQIWHLRDTRTTRKLSFPYYPSSYQSLLLPLSSQWTHSKICLCRTPGRYVKRKDKS